MNKFKEKVEEVEVEAPIIEEPIIEKKAKAPAKPSAFSNWLAQNMSKVSALSILPFLFFLTVLGMLYIANKHYAEKNIRQIEKINKELKELKWEHLTAKSILMSKSKQSEVAKITKIFGLNEAVAPPTKIVVENK